MHIDSLIQLYTNQPFQYNKTIILKRGGETKVGDNMGMTDKQFNGFVRFVLDDINEVIEMMEDGKEKEKLQKVADNLQQTLED